MNKITIELSNDKLSVINKCFAHGYKDHEITDSKDFKSLVNIARILATRFSKKAIDKQFTNKDFTMSFQYFEAYTLERIILMRMDEFYNQIYEFNVLRGIIAELDQKL